MADKGKLHETPGGAKIQNNFDMGRSGGGTPTRRRNLRANPTTGGGINRKTAGAKGGRGFSGGE